MSSVIPCGNLSRAFLGNFGVLLMELGLDRVRREQVPVEWGYGGSAEHWEKTLKLAAPIAEAVNGLEPEEREQVRATVAERIDTLLGGPGVGGLTHAVLAE